MQPEQLTVSPSALKPVYCCNRTMRKGRLEGDGKGFNRSFLLLLVFSPLLCICEAQQCAKRDRRREVTEHPCSPLVAAASLYGLVNPRHFSWCPSYSCHAWGLQSAEVLPVRCIEATWGVPETEFFSAYLFWTCLFISHLQSTSKHLLKGWGFAQTGIATLNLFFWK